MGVVSIESDKKNHGTSHVVVTFHCGVPFLCARGGVTVRVSLG